MTDDGPVPAWRVVQVDDLPWPHLPFKCRWAKSFEAAATDDFGEFVQALTAEQVAECDYHDASTYWVVAARVAVELVESGRIDRDDPYAAAEEHDHGRRARSWRSLPIRSFSTATTGWATASTGFAR